MRPQLEQMKECSLMTGIEKHQPPGTPADASIISLLVSTPLIAQINQDPKLIVTPTPDKGKTVVDPTSQPSRPSNV